MMTQNRFTSWLVSASIAFSSLSGMQVHAQTANRADNPCNSTILVEDLVTLLNLASYPDVPRRGETVPSAPAERDAFFNTKLSDVLKRILTTKANLERGFTARLINGEAAGCFSPSGETDPEIIMLKEIEKYFEAVSKYEGIKIMLGQKSDPNTWDGQYNLNFPMKDLSQSRFLENASAYAETAVLLPVEGYDADKLLPLIRAGSFYITHVESVKGEWMLRFRVNPSFAAKAEELAFLMRPSLKSSLQYAAHFSLTRLYDALILTRTLRRQKPEELPAPSTEARERFLSQKVAQSEARRMYQGTLDERQKPAIYKALLDTVEKSGVWALDDEFFTKLAQLNGGVYTAATEEVRKELHREEIANFGRSLSALLNLMDITDWKGLPRLLIRESKRLSLRALYLGDLEGRAKMSAESQSVLSDYIDQRSDRFADEVLAKYQFDLNDIGSLKIKHLQEINRTNFQQGLERASAIVRDYKEQEIQIAHMIGAVAPDIEGLEPSDVIKQQVASLATQQSYALAYNAFNSRLGIFLGEFLLDGKPVPKMNIKQLEESKWKLQWNPKALAGKVADKYISRMNKPGAKGWIWDDPSSRQKELFDWLKIGQLLKFDVFEQLGSTQPLVKNMQLDSGMIGRFTEPVGTAYQAEVKKALINESPLLGGLVTIKQSAPRGTNAFKRELWTILADDNKSAQEKWIAVEKQLGKAEELLQRNQAEISAQLAKVDAVQGQDVSALSEEMKVVATRSSQIVQGIEQYASFQSYYSRMRSQLLSPGLVMGEWQRFSTFANEKGMWLAAFMALQLFNGRAGMVGKLSERAGKLMTPFCGPNLQCLNVFFYGLIGVGISEQAYRGFISEPANLEIVRRYFECGSGAPCVAIYSDVVRQTEVMNQPRSQIMTTLVSLGVIIGGFWSVRKLISWWTAPGKNAVEAINRDLEVLGMNKNTSFSSDALKASTQEALKKVRLQADPVARAQGEAYIMQTYARVESTLRQEAQSWQGFYNTHKDAFAKLGLDKNSWTDAEAITNAATRVDNAYRAGRMLRSDYQEAMGTFSAIYSKVNPLWSSMEKQPILIGYYKRVFELSGQSSDVALRAAQKGFNEGISDKFLKQMDKFYGQPNGYRIDQIMQHIAKEVKESPAIRDQRVNVLKRYMETEIPK